MYKNKKIITLILTLAFIGLIGGCGKTTSENNSNNNKEATQEASLDVNNEETEKEETSKEEAMNANMKEVSVKPLMDIFDNIWGRKIDEWTMDELVSEFGMDVTGGDGVEACMWSTKYNSLGEGNTYFLDTGFDDCDFYDFTYEYNNHAKYGLDSFIDAEIYYKEGSYTYKQRIVSSSHNVLDNDIYQFCISNGLTTLEGVMGYLGIEENDFAEAENGIMRINTEMGQGAIGRDFDDNGKCKSISIVIYQYGSVRFSIESEIYNTDEECFMVEKDYY